MELGYAPAARSPNRVVLVLVMGILTTALTLIAVYLIDVKADTNVMGWHANYVIPAGAIFVGICASLGYGIASYVTGLKIRATLLWTILALQIGAYFSAQYVTFRSLGPLYEPGAVSPLSFPEYFNFVATHFAWKSENGKKGPEEALGEAGYFFIGLEILGFAAGSLLVPLGLMRTPYCELCQMYMKSKTLAVLPASVPFRKVKKKDSAGADAYGADQQAAYEAAHSRLTYFKELSAKGDAEALRASVDALKPGSKIAGKLPVRISVALVRCRGCNTGHLQPKLLRGQGKKLKKTNLPKIELTREVVVQVASPLNPHRAPLAAAAQRRMG